MKSSYTRVYHFLVTFLGLNILLDSSRNALFTKLVRPLENLFGGLGQPLRQIIAKLSIQILFFLLLLGMYTIFEYLHQNLASTTHQKTTASATDDEISTDTETPSLATIMYKPLLISAAIVRFVSIEVDLYSETPGGELIIWKYVLVSISFLIPLLLYYIYTQINVSGSQAGEKYSKWEDVIDVSYNLIFAFVIVGSLLSPLIWAFFSSDGLIARSEIIRVLASPISLISLTVFGLAGYTFYLKDSQMMNSYFNIPGIPEISTENFFKMYFVSLAIFTDVITTISFFLSPVLYLIIGFTINLAIVYLILRLFNEIDLSSSTQVEQGKKFSFVLALPLIFLLSLLEFFLYSSDVLNL